MDCTGIGSGHAQWSPWVENAVLTLRRRLPVYPDKQTFSVSVRMSQTCQ